MKTKITTLLIAIVAWASITGCFLVPLLWPEPKSEPQTCEEDYYRGVYTLCMVLNAQMVKGGASSLMDCGKLVEEAVEKGWHEKEAPGFEWPLPEPVSGLSARR